MLIAWVLLVTGSGLWFYGVFEPGSTAAGKTINDASWVEPQSTHPFPWPPPPAPNDGGYAPFERSEPMTP